VTPGGRALIDRRRRSRVERNMRAVAHYLVHACGLPPGAPAPPPRGRAGSGCCRAIGQSHAAAAQSGWVRLPPRRRTGRASSWAACQAAAAGPCTVRQGDPSAACQASPAGARGPSGAWSRGGPARAPPDPAGGGAQAATAAGGARIQQCPNPIRPGRRRRAGSDGVGAVFQRAPAVMLCKPTTNDRWDRRATELAAFAHLHGHCNVPRVRPEAGDPGNGAAAGAQQASRRARSTEANTTQAADVPRLLRTPCMNGAREAAASGLGAAWEPRGLWPRRECEETPRPLSRCIRMSMRAGQVAGSCGCRGRRVRAASAPGACASGAR